MQNINIFYDPLLRLYKNIQVIIERCEDIDNIMIKYLKKIFYVINTNRYENKVIKISKIINKLCQDLKYIYITYNEDYENEMVNIRHIYTRLKAIKDDEYIINNHIHVLSCILITDNV